MEQHTHMFRRGKMLGGSTGLNYMGWDRASKAEYDSWKLLADERGAWDWDSFLPYLGKAEAAAQEPGNDPFPSFSRAASDVVHPGLHSSDAVGRVGPVKVDTELCHRRHDSWYLDRRATPRCIPTSSRHMSKHGTLLGNTPMPTRYRFY